MKIYVHVWWGIGNRLDNKEKGVTIINRGKRQKNMCKQNMYLSDEFENQQKNESILANYKIYILTIRKGKLKQQSKMDCHFFLLFI